jgi:hypothetical protein
VKILEVAGAAVNGNAQAASDRSDNPAAALAAPYDEEPSCTIKTLPDRLCVPAANTAVKVNPVNAPSFAASALLATNAPLGPMAIAVMTSKYWGPTARKLTVSFMESTQPDLRARILSHMNAWARVSCVTFVEVPDNGDVRISRGPGGYWSYLGTDILHIPKDRPTMNLEGFTMNTLDSEYLRVVRHETGHTLGFPHEHMREELVQRIDPQKAYDYFYRQYGWNKTTVDQQVLTALDQQSVMATPPDQTSIMCYQLPGSITRDGRPIVGGVDINNTDYAFAARIYPRAAMDTPDAARDQAGPSTWQDAWSASEDVEVTL